MTQKTDNIDKPPVKSGGVSAKEARLKAALKANMGRRKAQARARADIDVADSGAENNENE